MLAGLLLSGAAQALTANQTGQALQSLSGLGQLEIKTEAGTTDMRATFQGFPLSAYLPAAPAHVLLMLDDADLPPQRWPAQTGAAVIRLGGLTGSQLPAELNAAHLLLEALNKTDSPTPPLLAGNGVGGLAVILLLERREPVVGGLSVCAPVSGWAAQVANLTDFRLVYDYFTRSLAGTRLTGLSDPVNTATLPTPAQTAASVDALFAGAPTIDRFNANLGQIGDVTHVRADAGAYRLLLDAYSREVPRWQAAYGGFPYNNAATSYQSSMDDDPMNVGVARTAAVAGLADQLKTLTPTGHWSQPLLTLHDLSDPLYSEDTEAVLRSRAGGSPLTQFTVQNVGSGGVRACDVPDDAVLSAYRTLQTWVAGGPKPPDRTLDAP
ncbi:hypothetical protein GCM10022631_09290 [Deinococcus rubellus]